MLRAPRRQDLRTRMEDAIERMIAVLDTLDAPDEDLEDGCDAEADGADKEPSLGSPELSWEYFNSQEHWSRGGAFEVDAEEDRSDDEDGADDEPSLAAPEITDLFTNSDQTYWAKGGSFLIDAEHDDSDDEPSLGSLGSGDPEARSAWSGGGTLDFEEEHDGRELQDEF